MFDTHMHTSFSSDSEMNIEKVIETIDRNKIGAIITDHMDLKYPDSGRFVFDVDEFFREYSKYRSDRLLLGIEIGMRPDCLEDNRKIANGHSFDFVIGSVHVVNNVDIYDESFYSGRSKKEAYEEYLEFMLQCVKTYDFIDSLGHIDYISRYARYEDAEIYYREYSDYIDEILKTVIENRKVMEINTRRLNDDIAFENLIDIYRRYRELGGNMVTIGSDAHNEGAIGSNFLKALYIAEKCGLKTVYFRNRKAKENR